MEEEPKKTQGMALRRKGQAPAPAPETTGKKKNAPTGMILMAAAGSLFIMYLTNTGDVQTGIDGFLGAQVHSAHNHDSFVATWFVFLLPYIAMAMVVAVLYVMLASFGVGKTKQKPKPLTDALTSHEFAELATATGISVRVSREMYRMLLPRYDRVMRSTLNRTFTELEVSPETVWGMFEELVHRSGGVIRGHVGIEALGTPIDMMKAAEQCLERAALERRAILQKTAALAEEVSRAVVPVPAVVRR